MRRVYSPPPSGAWTGVRVVGALLITLVVFLVLPLTQLVSSYAKRDLLITKVDSTVIQAPPPPDEAPPPPPEEEAAPGTTTGSLRRTPTPGDQRGPGCCGRHRRRPGDESVGRKRGRHPRTRPGAGRVRSGQAPDVDLGDASLVSARAATARESKVWFRWCSCSRNPARSKTRGWSLRAVLSSNDPALEAIRRWRFKPGMKDGEAVKTYMRQPIRFRVAG